MAKISIDFTRQPTDKMAQLVDDITQLLHLNKPEYTFEAYSQFISKYKDDYYSIKNELDALEDEEEEMRK